MPASRPKRNTYADAGVDIDSGDKLVELIEPHMRRTHGPRVIGKHGAFAGCFRLDYNEQLFKRNYREPILLACTDGVGTKIKLAAKQKSFQTIGQDLVAMSVNDLIVQGAEPLFFLDYLAVHKLDPPHALQLVRGVADACAESDCALLGGETAEMPDLYRKGDFDLAGFAVGVCELKRMITGDRIERGDVILGLGSSGIHSNGYSLVRAIVSDNKLDLNRPYADLDTDRTLGEVLLAPTRLYVRPVLSVLRRYTVKQVVTGMSHVTGGGLPGNVGRGLGAHLNARIKKGSWEVPAVFDFLAHHGRVAGDEMLRVFNMGVGYVMIVKPHFADSIMDQLTHKGERVSVIGKITPGTGRVQLG